MILNSAHIFCLVPELKDQLLGLRITRVDISSDQREILFSLRGKDERRGLFFSSRSENCRVEVWQEGETEQGAQVFQKTNLFWYSVGGYVQKVEQVDFDRIIRISCRKKTQFGSGEPFDLVFEITGRNSNVILIKQGGTIVDCLRKVDATRSRLRRILPGEKYVPPPAPRKTNPLMATYEEFSARLRPSDRTAVEWLVSAFMGMDDLLARRIMIQSNLEGETRASQLSRKEARDLWTAFDQLFRGISNGKLAFQVVTGRDGSPEAIACVDLPFLPDVRKVHFEALNSAIKSFFSLKLQKEHRKTELHYLSATVQRALSRLRKRESKIEDDLKQAERLEEYRRFGDLLMMNKGNIRKGQATASLVDVFDPAHMTVEIPLDPKLSAVGNAQRYYKKHKKARDALSTIEKRSLETKKSIEDLARISEQLKKPQEQIHLGKIRRNLVRLGLLREPKPADREKEKKSLFRSFVTKKGREILVGRNNRENDYLTFKLARPDDLWFHAEGVPGSHVLLRMKDKTTEPSSAEIREAAGVAAYFSKSRQENKAEVIYTLAKYVRKPKRAKPGTALVEKEKSIVVKPALPNAGDSTGEL